MAGTTHASRPAMGGATSSPRRRAKHRGRLRAPVDADAERLRELIWSKTHEEWLTEMSPEARERTKRFDRLRAKIGPMNEFDVVEELRRVRSGQ